MPSEGTSIYTQNDATMYFEYDEVLILQFKMSQNKVSNVVWEVVSLLIFAGDEPLHRRDI